MLFTKITFIFIMFIYDCSVLIQMAKKVFQFAEKIGKREGGKTMLPLGGNKEIFLETF